MKKFAYLLSFIVPNITNTYVTDDGAVHITFMRGPHEENTIIPMADYEHHVSINKKIYGLFDRANGLS